MGGGGTFEYCIHSSQLEGSAFPFHPFLFVIPSSTVKESQTTLPWSKGFANN